jgi:hypothetical protein
MDGKLLNVRVVRVNDHFDDPARFNLSGVPHYAVAGVRGRSARQQSDENTFRVVVRENDSQFITHPKSDTRTEVNPARPPLLGVPDFAM